MARGINKVILVGNVGQDPEVRTGATGSQVARISLATNESWTDQQTGDRQQRTEWHRVKFFGRLAEIVAEYVVKGRQLYVEGSLRTEPYTGSDGIQRYSTDIIGHNLQLLGGGHDQEQPNSQQAPQRAQQQAPQRAQQSAPQGAQQRTQQQPRQSNAGQQRSQNNRSTGQSQGYQNPPAQRHVTHDEPAYAGTFDDIPF